MDIRALEPGDREALERFIGRVPEADRTFFKEDVEAPEVIDAWTHPGPARAIAVADGEVVGPLHRGRGIGRALARRAVLEAVALDLHKMVVEVVADQAPTIAMFRALGFDPEALLTDHVRDQSGALRDLMVLAQSVEAQWAAMSAGGIAHEL